MTDLATKISIMQAALDGKEIEVRYPDNTWRKVPDAEEEEFNWCDEDYRVKKEPMEFWVNVWDNGHCCIKNDNEATPPGFKTIKVREVTE